MRPTTRRTLETTMRHRPPVTRDARPRQLPTVPSHAVPTGECQSDPPSLPRTVRCSRPRANPSTRAGPLDSLLHVSGLTGNVRRVPGPRSRGASVHARPCQGYKPCLRTIAAPGLVLATQEPGNVTGQTTMPRPRRPLRAAARARAATACPGARDGRCERAAQRRRAARQLRLPRERSRNRISRRSTRCSLSLTGRCAAGGPSHRSPTVLIGYRGRLDLGGRWEGIRFARPEPRRQSSCMRERAGQPSPHSCRRERVQPLCLLQKLCLTLLAKHSVGLEHQDSPPGALLRRRDRGGPACAGDRVNVVTPPPSACASDARCRWLRRAPTAAQ